MKMRPLGKESIKRTAFVLSRNSHADLLAAAEECNQFLNEDGNHPSSPGSRYDWLLKVREQLKAAIAKAEGE